MRGASEAVTGTRILARALGEAAPAPDDAELVEDALPDLLVPRSLRR